MKKFLKFLGGVAVAATVIPYNYKKDEESGEKTIQALLWKASLPEKAEDGTSKLKVSFGFNNPFQSEDAVDESDLFVHDVHIDYDPVCECECSEECAEVNPCCCENAVEEMAEDAAEAVEEVVEAVEEAVEETAETVEELVSEIVEDTAE